MANIPVAVPTGTTNPVKVKSSTDENGAAYIQIIQLGADDQGQQIVDLLGQIRDEIRAVRFQNAAAMNVPFEPTPALLDSIP